MGPNKHLKHLHSKGHLQWKKKDNPQKGKKSCKRRYPGEFASNTYKQLLQGNIKKQTALKQVYYQGWTNHQQRLDAWDKCSGLVHWEDPEGWDGREAEGGSGWGTHVNPWLIHVNVWQKPLQYCKVISLQLIKINGKKNPPNNPVKNQRTFLQRRHRDGHKAHEKLLNITNF